MALPPIHSRASLRTVPPSTTSSFIRSPASTLSQPTAAAVALLFITLHSLHTHFTPVYQTARSLTLTYIGTPLPSVLSFGLCHLLVL